MGSAPVPSGLSSAEVGSLRCIFRSWPPEGSEALVHTPGTLGTCSVEESISFAQTGTCEQSWFDP